MTQSLFRRHRLYFVFSLALAAYFSLLFLLNAARVDSVIVGVFGELLTIPMLVAQVVLIVFVLRALFRRGEPKTALLGGALLVCVATIVGMIIIN
jgi:hypothetical protein